jgi:hypothetical protein
MDDKKYMFVITACDGRHEHKPGTYEDALRDAADWHGKDLGHMALSSSTADGEWEGMDGQITRIEVVGEYDAFMKAEFGDDDG